MLITTLNLDILLVRFKGKFNHSLVIHGMKIKVMQGESSRSTHRHQPFEHVKIPDRPLLAYHYCTLRIVEYLKDFGGLQPPSGEPRGSPKISLCILSIHHLFPGIFVLPS
jgi:hypothetical protein